MTKFTYNQSDLAEHIAKLANNRRDYDFAVSLVQKAKRWAPSEKQAYWIDHLTKKAKGELQQVQAPKVEIGNMAGVQEHFNKAKSKSPTLHFGDVSVFRTTGRSKYPGAISIKSGDKWYGYIHLDGRFEQNRREQIPAGLIDLLKEFAADPRGTATKYGRNTGRCCFCGASLFGENETSQKLGYGPGCAKTWGLPWGVKAARESTATKEDLAAVATVNRTPDEQARVDRIRSDVDAGELDALARNGDQRARAKLARQFDRTFNEGGEGFNPYRDLPRSDADYEGDMDSQASRRYERSAYGRPD